MKVGIQMIFQSYRYGEDVSDGQVYDEEVALGILADELGYDALWPVEHHFEDYSFCPDNVVFLAYMAARTRRIGLGTGAVIVPWNDPLRVAEKISMLDQLSGGRVLLGLGRGLARREYERTGIEMSTSRERFDEAAPMILDALESGVMAGEGPYYPQGPAPVRPAPARSFRERTYCVAMSPDSVVEAARIRARMVMFSQRPYDAQLESIDRWRDLYREFNGEEPPPPVCCDFVYCDADPGRAEAKAREHIVGYLESVLYHYELASDHLKDAAGYESYGEAVDALKAVGLEAMADAYLGVNVWGTPDQVVERLRVRRDLIGEFDLTGCFRYAGLPFEDARESLRLFAAEVLPVLRAPAPIAPAG